MAIGHGQTKQGYLWTCNQPADDVFFRWETSRAADCLQNLLGSDFKGILQCDGYSAYRAFADRADGIKLSGYWRTSEESSTIRWNKRQDGPGGLCARSSISTGSNPLSVKSRQAQICAMQSDRTNAARF